MGRIKRIGLLLALLAAALGLGGCGYDASVEELFTLPRMAEGYTDLAQQLDGLLNQGYEYASPPAGATSSRCRWSIWTATADRRRWPSCAAAATKSP